MPSFLDPFESEPIKMLYTGHYGAGKTGSLVSLAAAGYDIRIADLDGLASIVRGYLTDPVSPYRKAHPEGLWTKEQAETIAERMSYVDLTEEYIIKGAKSIPKGTAWMRLNSLLNNWIDGPRKFGNVGTWGPETILVIDGLSRATEAAMNFHLTLNGRAESGPRVGTSDANDYTAAYRLILDHLNLLKSKDVKCNIIYICHIKFIEEPNANPQTRGQRSLRGFPQTIGPMLSPQIGQYFNTCLRAKSMADGKRRTIVTNNDESVDLKNPVPLKVKPEYSLWDGLAQYFRAVRSESGGPGQTKADGESTSEKKE